MFNCICLCTSCSPMHVVSDRYLDPDPLLLAAPHGNGDEVNNINPRFHALNQALVQLVSRVAIKQYMVSACPSGSCVMSGDTDLRRTQYMRSSALLCCANHGFRKNLARKRPIKQTVIFLPHFFFLSPSPVSILVLDGNCGGPL
jgi:hypothetical protein